MPFLNSFPIAFFISIPMLGKDQIAGRWADQHNNSLNIKCLFHAFANNISFTNGGHTVMCS